MSTEIDPWICRHCYKPNSAEAKHVRAPKRKDFHLWLDPVVFTSLKNYCGPYRSMNNGIKMMLWELDRYRMMDNMQTIKHNVPVHTIEEDDIQT